MKGKHQIYAANWIYGHEKGDIKMAKWVSAAESFADPKKRKQLEGLFISFFPKFGSLDISNFNYFPKNVKVYDAHTEFNLGWHMTIGEDNTLILVSHQPTKETRVDKYDSTDFGFIHEFLLKFGRTCYSDLGLGAQGSYLSIGKYEKLSECFKMESERKYLIASYDIPISLLYKPISYYVARNGAVSDSMVEEVSVDFGLKHYISYRERQFFIRPIVVFYAEDVLLKLGDFCFDGKSPDRGIEIKVVNPYYPVNRNNDIFCYSEHIEQQKWEGSAKRFMGD